MCVLKTEENINAAAERDKAIMRMHDEGISARQIAKILKNEHPGGISVVVP